LDEEHPFRGFLIACAVIFVICYFGHHGIYSEYDDYTDISSTYSRICYSVPLPCDKGTFNGLTVKWKVRDPAARKGSNALS
jgi:hypothetical protein